ARRPRPRRRVRGRAAVGRRAADGARHDPAAQPLPARAGARRQAAAGAAAAGRGGGQRRRSGHRPRRRDRMGRGGAPRDRGAPVAVAGRTDRHGGQPALRRQRDLRQQDLRPAQRLAELDLHPTQRGRPRGCPHPLRPTRARSLRLEPHMSTVDLDAKIPNNVGLKDDKRLLRALEKWQPNFRSWWKEMSPVDFLEDLSFLRTAVRVGKGGWAHFHYVKMAEYRWGIFLVELVEGRKIHFGDYLGQPVWNEVPGEFRNRLRRLIVTQGDTEPASVEQQRMLGHTCPSLYDLRSLFQVNVEEGRHLWAMVYL